MVLGINWIDWLILLVLFLAVIDGWAQGGFELVRSLLSFLGSLWLAVRFHIQAGYWLGQKFGVAQAWQNVVGYIVVAAAGQLVLSLVLESVVKSLPDILSKSKINRSAGVILSVANGAVIMAFLLLLLLALPVKGTLKEDIRISRLGSQLVAYADKYGGSVKSDLDQAAAQATKFLTIEPASGQSLSLANSLPDGCSLTVDSESEKQMVILVNREREKAGVKDLKVDERMTEVAEGHSRDMFVRKYFSHVTPEGVDPSGRFDQARISYQIVGENIAFSPDLATAHTGLMNSPGHRANILDKDFTRAGIGIINGGVCGMMFSQDFAN